MILCLLCNQISIHIVEEPNEVLETTPKKKSGTDVEEGHVAADIVESTSKTPSGEVSSPVPALHISSYDHIRVVELTFAIKTEPHPHVNMIALAYLLNCTASSCRLHGNLMR